MGVAETIRESIRSLRQSPRELFVVYVLKFLESFSYFSFSIIFTIYLTDEVRGRQQPSAATGFSRSAAVAAAAATTAADVAAEQ